MKSINGILVIEENDVPKTAFSIISGGLDSTLATYLATKEFSEVIPIFFDWGQKAIEEEKKAVSIVCSLLNLNPPFIISAPIYKWDKSAITINNPEEPNYNNFMVCERNLVFISLAASYARSKGGGYLVVGFNKQDGGYDTSTTFIDSVNALFDQLNIDYGKEKIGLYAPIIERNKSEIIKELKQNKLLEMTYSCYVAGGPCRVCPACIKRQQHGG